MPFKLFGFQIGKERQDKTRGRRSFVPPENQDGSVVMESGGMFGHFLDVDGSFRNETELITRYRDMANQPEVDTAIRHIINEAIVVEEHQSSISLVLDKLDYSEETKDMIRKEFENVMNLLDFNNQGQDIFRKWYVDGRIYYHIMVDEKDPREGIQELRYIDPRDIHKVTLIDRATNSENIDVITDMKEYFVYNRMGADLAGSGSTGAIIAPHAIAYAHSGIPDHNSQMIIGHLHKAIKPLNQLRMMEDATVIYRMSRAPERRAFYIDVGNLPKGKAEQYLNDVMNKYRTKIMYDAQTGEIRDDKKFLSMMEDYWLPRRDGNRGTEIQTLQGGANLSELLDVEYFQMKLYQSLNVPVSRLKPDTGFSLGRAAEVTRDELSFSKFVSAVRNQFTTLLDTLLSRQLMIKGIISYDDWAYIRQRIFYSFLKDTYFSDLKNLEIMREQFNFARDLGLSEFVGSVVSLGWVRREILKQTEDIVKTMDEEMAEEKAKGISANPGGDMGGGGFGDDGSFGGEGGDGMEGAEGGDEGEPGGEDDIATDDAEELDDETRQAVEAAAEESGVDPDTIVSALTTIMSGEGEEISDEEKEVLIATAKQAGVDHEPIIAALDELGDEEQPEEDEEATPDEENPVQESWNSKSFRKSLEKLWQ